MNFLILNPNAPLPCGPSYSLLCSISGDDSGFVSFDHVAYGSQLTQPTSAQGYMFNYNLAFNPDGTLSGSILENGFYSNTDIHGFGMDWSGIVRADFYMCPMEGCTVDGYFSSVGPIPEPSTWALMLSGLLGIGALAARRRLRTA